MPKVSVRVPTSLEPAEALAKVLPALEKTVADFQGHDLEMNGSETTSQFTFRSMAFTIKGQLEARPGEVAVEVELPFAAIMFKDKAERAITKNVTRALEAPG
jgi:hypothetical protein